MGSIGLGPGWLDDEARIDTLSLASRQDQRREKILGWDASRSAVFAQHGEETPETGHGSMTDEPTDQQTDCCPHTARYLCACPQGFRSHAMGPEEEECQCGKIKIAEAVWQNCSGQTHVFQPEAARCGCGQRSARVEVA